MLVKKNPVWLEDSRGSLRLRSVVPSPS